MVRPDLAAEIRILLIKETVLSLIRDLDVLEDDEIVDENVREKGTIGAELNDTAYPPLKEAVESLLHSHGVISTVDVILCRWKVDPLPY